MFYNHSHSRPAFLEIILAGIILVQTFVLS